MIFSTDTQSECELICKASIAAGAANAVICTHWKEGGQGATELADAVISVCNTSSNFRFVYLIIYFAC